MIASTKLRFFCKVVNLTQPEMIRETFLFLLHLSFTFSVPTAFRVASTPGQTSELIQRAKLNLNKLKINESKKYNLKVLLFRSHTKSFSQV